MEKLYKIGTKYSLNYVRLHCPIPKKLFSLFGYVRQIIDTSFYELTMTFVKAILILEFGTVKILCNNL
jgi:hypothetical protein